MKNKSDNLFDTTFTFLDAVKLLLLVVTLFSTWNVVDILTPDSSVAFIREIAAVGMVEGAFLGFEAATKNAKSKRQKQFSTIGFFCSLAVIGMFAATSGLLEFGGDILLLAPAGSWLGMDWLVKDWVIVGSLGVLVGWIVALAALYRLYSLNDPDLKAGLDRMEIEETVSTEANEALKLALRDARPVIASHRALAAISLNYSGELKPAEMEKLKQDVQAHLNEKYLPAAPSNPANPAPGAPVWVVKEAASPSPLPNLDEPTS